MRLLVTILILFLYTAATAQEFQPKLSPKHLAKVEATENPVKKLQRYKRFYHRDSIRLWRDLGKNWDKQSDSIADVIHQRKKALEERRHRLADGVKSKIYETVYRPWANKQADQQLRWLDQHDLQVSRKLRIVLKQYFVHYFLQASQQDSMLAVLKMKMPSLPLPKELASKVKSFEALEGYKITHLKNKTTGLHGVARDHIHSNMHVAKAMQLNDEVKRYSSQADQFGQYAGMVSDPDSLSRQAQEKAEQVATDYISHNVDGLDELTSAQQQMESYSTQLTQLQDSTFLQQQAQQKAEEMAMEYLANNPAIMKTVETKMNLLMKKYSVVPNSNDLTTAIKRTSLKGRSFRERLYFSGNFQLLSLEPFSIDWSPMIGYRFNTKFIAGVGGNYRQSFGDSIPTLSPNVMGAKAFASFDVFRNFFAYAEYDRNSIGIQKTETGTKRLWKNAAFLGIGRKLRLHRKLEVTAICMYNFLYEHPDPVYPKRWTFRIGVQTTDLAFFKPKSR